MPMNVGDILINFDLLQEQYEFLSNHAAALDEEAFINGTMMNQWDIDMWDGILNLLETILDFRQPLDKPALS